MAEYSSRLEDSKRALAEEILEDCYPLVAAKYNQGIVVATSNPFSNIKKIREIYPGILLGAIGEIAAIDSVAEHLINNAHYQELSFSSKDVRIIQLIKEISRTIWQTFVDGRLRPIICEFVVTNHDSSFVVSFDGSVEEVKDYMVLASRAKREKMESQLKDHFRPEMTLAELIELIHQLLGEKNLELVTLEKGKFERR